MLVARYPGVIGRAHRLHDLVTVTCGARTEISALLTSEAAKRNGDIDHHIVLIYMMTGKASVASS